MFSTHCVTVRYVARRVTTATGAIRISPPQTNRARRRGLRGLLTGSPQNYALGRPIGPCQKAETCPRCADVAAILPVSGCPPVNTPSLHRGPTTELILTTRTVQRTIAQRTRHIRLAERAKNQRLAERQVLVPSVGTIIQPVAERAEHHR